jgi:hypothetical protein
MPGSSKWSISLRFSQQIPVYSSPLPHTHYMPSPFSFFLILSLEQYWLRSTKQRFDTLKSTCFVIRHSGSRFGVLSTLLTSIWSSSGICCCRYVQKFQGNLLPPSWNICRHKSVDMGQGGPVQSAGWANRKWGGGVSWTSKSTKKQNGTIENSVCDWSELENRLQHGVPVG